MERGGIRDACQGAVGLLCIVWLSRLSLSVCRRGFQALHRIRPSSLFRNVGKPQSDAGEIPKRIHTIFKTRRKFEIKNTVYFSSKQESPFKNSDYFNGANVAPVQKFAIHTCS